MVGGMTHKKEKAEEADADAPVSSLGILAIEIVVYAALVTAYLLVVLRALRPVLLATSEHHRVVYGFLAVGLMLGQGLVLEVLTSLLVGRFRRARRDDAAAAAKA